MNKQKIEDLQCLLDKLLEEGDLFNDHIDRLRNEREFLDQLNKDVISREFEIEPEDFHLALEHHHLIEDQQVLDCHFAMQEMEANL